MPHRRFFWYWGPGTVSLGKVIPISFAVAILLATVVVSYRETVRAYPNGGGAYIVAHENLGTYPGLLAAAALLDRLRPDRVGFDYCRSGRDYVPRLPGLRRVKDRAGHRHSSSCDAHEPEGCKGIGHAICNSHLWIRIVDLHHA